MKFTGSYKLNVKKEIVWKALNNTDILKQCIPGCQSFEKDSNTVFNVTAINQIGPMNAVFSGTVTLSNIKKNQSYTLSGEGKSSVGFINGSADVDLKEEEKNGTAVTEKRVNEIKSNFLNKYIYSAITILILLLVAIIYFVSR